MNITPQAFGVGWTLNLYQVARRLGLIGKGIPETSPADALAESQSGEDGQSPPPLR